MSRRRRNQSSFFLLFIVGVLASAVMSMGAGYLYGTSSVKDVFTMRQQRFVTGVAVGAQLRGSSPKGSLDDLHADCAGRFYPDQPISMAGCVQALDGAPKGGYKLPPP